MQALTLLVGPEGGWSDKELEQARQAGVQAVRFGPRVLRTETAGLALLSAVSALLGW
ncbi:Ribosomal RNA small subunit methyltransferase E [compost metagenome]